MQYNENAIKIELWKIERLMEKIYTQNLLTFPQLNIMAYLTSDVLKAYYFAGGAIIKKIILSNAELQFTREHLLRQPHIVLHVPHDSGGLFFVFWSQDIMGLKAFIERELNVDLMGVGNEIRAFGVPDLSWVVNQYIQKEHTNG